MLLRVHFWIKILKVIFKTCLTFFGTGTAENILHIHYYDKNLKRTDAAYLDKATFEKYKKYLKGMKWYDKR